MDLTNLIKLFRKRFHCKLLVTHCIFTSFLICVFDLFCLFLFNWYCVISNCCFLSLLVFGTVWQFAFCCCHSSWDNLMLFFCHTWQFFEYDWSSDKTRHLKLSPLSVGNCEVHFSLSFDTLYTVTKSTSALIPEGSNSILELFFFFFFFLWTLIAISFSRSVMVL